MATLREINKMIEEAELAYDNITNLVGKPDDRAIHKIIGLGVKHIGVSTYNYKDSSQNSVTGTIHTDDGWRVTWFRRDIGLHTGEDFLPAAWFELPWQVTWQQQQVCEKIPAMKGV